MAKSTPKPESRRPRRDPENPLERKLTSRQAAYFADAAGIAADDLVGVQLGEITEKLKWHIDPALWFYQRVCGRVVKTDPVTGEQQGVPFATVHVEDTDCTFLGLVPVEDPYFWWIWPLSCHQEEIATVTTDACGYFCVNIPRWDIDRVLRFRKERLCLEEVGRPRIPDLIDERIPDFGPGDPDPIDPPPYASIFGRGLDGPAQIRRFGEAPPQPMEGPTRRLTAPVDAGTLKRARRSVPDGIELPNNPRLIGPFLRCRDVYVAEWEYLVDVPDITFRVTQDVDGDGTEEVIYSEGIFDVRWNDSSIGPVLLEASPIARSVVHCDGDDELPCTDIPAILEVGRMPTAAPYLDANGYAIRVNRPRVGGDETGATNGDAESPFLGELQLSACYDSVDGAQYFRVLDDFDGVEQPITGVSWVSASPIAPFFVDMVPDADGWYAISDAQKQLNDHLVMSWPAAGRGSGLHTVRLELADGSKNHLDYSAPVPLMTDDRAPEATLMSVKWRVKGGGQDWATASELLGVSCPVILRPANTPVELQVRWTAAGDHFRDGELVANGCGSGSVPTWLSGTGSSAIVDPPVEIRRWYETTGETGLSRTDVFDIAGSAAQGAYGVTVTTWSRAFSPAGSAGPSADWEINPSHRHARTALRFAVIDN